jgi:ribosomal protein L12E/L44/L45/RPP1/RPP2
VQVGAEEETIRSELRRAASEVGVEVDDAWVEEKAREISVADPAQG